MKDDYFELYVYINDFGFTATFNDFKFMIEFINRTVGLYPYAEFAVSKKVSK